MKKRRGTEPRLGGVFWLLAVVGLVGVYKVASSLRSVG